MELLIILLILAFPAGLILKFYDKKNPNRNNRKFFDGIDDFFSPRLFSKRKEKVVVKKKPDIDYLMLFGLFIFMYVTKLITLITKYYPFSLFFQDRMFHYQYKIADQISGKIRLKFSVIPELLDQDYHFLYLFYNQKGLTIPKLEKELKNDNVYISLTDKNLIKIAIPRV